jgi:hypothetical protein
LIVGKKVEKKKVGNAGCYVDRVGGCAGAVGSDLIRLGNSFHQVFSFWDGSGSVEIELINLSNSFHQVAKLCNSSASIQD